VSDSDNRQTEPPIKAAPILLERLKAQDADVWQRFVDLYSPLISHWCLRSGFQGEEVVEVGREILKTVSTSIGDFPCVGEGDSIQQWLRRIARTRIIDHQQRAIKETEPVGDDGVGFTKLDIAETLEDTDASSQDDTLILIRRAADLILSSCDEKSRQSFLRVLIAGEDPRTVALELGVTVNEVYSAKSQVLRRFREEFSDLFGI